MAREKLKPQRDYSDENLDTLPAAADVVEPVYDVEVDELNHEELQILATEVGKEKQAAKNQEAVDIKVMEIESKIATEKAWDEKVARVESKVERVIPKPKGYERRVGEIRKLDEAQLKVYETQRDDQRKAEEKRISDARTNEPKRLESNETKKVQAK